MHQPVSDGNIAGSAGRHGRWCCRESVPAVSWGHGGHPICRHEVCWIVHWVQSLRASCCHLQAGQWWVFIVCYYYHPLHCLTVQSFVISTGLVTSLTGLWLKAFMDSWSTMFFQLGCFFQCPYSRSRRYLTLAVTETDQKNWPRAGAGLAMRKKTRTLIQLINDDSIVKQALGGHDKASDEEGDQRTWGKEIWEERHGF